MAPNIRIVVRVVHCAIVTVMVVVIVVVVVHHDGVVVIASLCGGLRLGLMTKPAQVTAGTLTVHEVYACVRSVVASLHTC